MIIWFYMNEMVRDAVTTVVSYRIIVLDLIGDETEDGIYEFELKFLNEATGSYIPSAERVG